MNADLNAIDVRQLDVVAKVSSAARLRARWTELAIYYRPGERRPFVAEIVGGTHVVSESRRARRRVFAELDGCFDFFDAGDLTERARTQAADWFRRNKHKLTDRTRDAASAALGTTLGFTGSKLADALAWLYPDGTGQLEWTQAERLDEFERAWGIPVATAKLALTRDAADAPMQPWCRAFVSSLLFFDRNAFHTAGGTHVAR